LKLNDDDDDDDDDEKGFILKLQTIYWILKMIPKIGVLHPGIPLL